VGPRVADLDRLGLGRQLVNKLVVDTSLDEMARRGDTGLAGTDESAEGSVVDRLIDVEVIEYQNRRLAAKFKGLVDEISRRCGRRQTAGLGAAGQNQFVDIGMRGERLAGGRAEACYDVQDTRRQAGLRKDLSEAQRRQRRVFRRLDDGRAARSNGWRDITRRDQKWVVERSDVGDHPDRATERVSEIGPVDRDHRIALGQSQTSVVTKQVGHSGQLRARLAGRSAVVERFQLVELFEMLFQRVAQRIKKLGAGPVGKFAPFRVVEGATGAFDRGIDVAVTRVDGMGDDFTVCRRNDWKSLAPVRDLFLAIDEQAAHGC
jgi:hypothetical protein